jgi:anti-sigma factor RsiW
MNNEQLYAYLDGELGPEETARVESALASEPALAAELDLLRGVDRALGTLPGHEAPDDLADRVLEEARRRGRGRLVRLALPLAAAAALALALFLPGQHGNGNGLIEEFTPEEHINYVWESDAETFGSLGLSDLEDQILEGLDSA